MKIKLSKAGDGSKFYTDDGEDISSSLAVKAVTIRASVEHITTATLDLSLIETHEEHQAEPIYSIAGYTNVKGLLLESGEIVYLPEKGE